MDGVVMEINSLEETFERWFLELDFHKQLEVKPAEVAPVEDSLGRVTAGPVFARVASPDYYAASVDGVAVLSSMTFGVTEHNPLRLEIGRDAFFVDTGSMMPANTDAVIPIEQVRLPSIDQVEIRDFSAPWENVRPRGEDVAAKELILPAFHRIRPLDIAALYLGGLDRVSVVKKPKVAILPLGTGLLPAGSQPQQGKVFETCSRIISSIVKKVGGIAHVMDITPETVEGMIEKSRESFKGHDLLIIIGGPSKGTHPIAEIINRFGELVSYGIKIKPGMSSCLGVVDKLPVMGVSQYAMSSFIIFQLFGIPLIYKKLGLTKPQNKKLSAYLSQKVYSPKDVSEFIRVSLGEVDGLPVAVPVSRGADVLMSLVRADGIIRIKPEKRSLDAGEQVEVELLRSAESFDRKVLLAGTYDPCFELLRNTLQQKRSRVSLLCSNVGSMRGLMALKAGYCHIGSVHLFDDETGEFNVPFVKKFLDGMPLILVNLFYRQLGFIVQKGNPKNITTFEDLRRDDVKIVNRIRGSGTRVIFDYYLREKGIDLNQVRGYSDEAHTHLNLASAVASGSADAGLGILEAAKATHLDFIPMIPERLDLVAPKKYMGIPTVRALFEVMNSEEFKKEMSNMQGYDVSSIGKVLLDK